MSFDSGVNLANVSFVLAILIRFKIIVIAYIGHIFIRKILEIKQRGKNGD